MKPVHFVVFILLVMFLNACSQSGAGLIPAVTAITPTTGATQIPLPTITPTPNPAEDCSAEDEPTFADYPSWTQVNTQPIQGHEVWVNIFVNDLAEKTYLSASGEVFPECSKIVKTHLEDAESQTISAITVMVKMPPGYDPQHNDWWWGMYDKTGQFAEMSGVVSVCIECHQPVADTDYVFSKAVLAESKK